MEKILKVQNIEKYYGSKSSLTKAINDISFEVEKGEFVAIMGASGSGKTTLLNCISTIDKVTSGHIFVDGEDVTKLKGNSLNKFRRNKLGFIFQEFNLLDTLTGYENISLALSIQGVSYKEQKKRIDTISEKLGITKIINKYPYQMSGGEKQRIASARAIITNPSIVLADEPTGALDSNTGKQVFDTLKKLSKEKLIIVVSHDRDFAEIYGDRIIELADGKIISDMSKFHIEPKEISGNINVINDNVLSIKDVNELKREDLDKIYDLLKSKQGEVIITSSDKNVKTIKDAIHISDDNKSEVFNNTEKVDFKEYDPKNTKFIKSHLPFAKAFKIGASSLKSKPIRMIFTIILTVVALIMFGVTSTLMLYDQSYSVKEA